MLERRVHYLLLNGLVRLYVLLLLLQNVISDHNHPSYLLKIIQIITKHISPPVWEQLTEFHFQSCALIYYFSTSNIVSFRCSQSVSQSVSYVRFVYESCRKLQGMWLYLRKISLSFKSITSFHVDLIRIISSSNQRTASDRSKGLVKDYLSGNLSVC